MTENSRSADHAGDSQAGSASASVPEGTNARRVFVKTYGCQMNVYDSERMADALAPEGYETTQAVEDADLIEMCYMSRDFRHGLEAFLAKEKPEWSGT